MSDAPGPVKLLPDPFLVTPDHALPAYPLRNVVDKSGDIPGTREIKSVFPQHLPVKGIIMCSYQRLTGHSLQQGGVGAARAMTVEIQTGKEFQVMNFLLIINDSAKKDPFIPPEFLLQVFTKLVDSIAYHQDLLIGIAFREAIEDSLDIIFGLHTGHQQKIIAGADPIFPEHTLVCVLEQLCPVSDIFTFYPVFFLEVGLDHSRIRYVAIAEPDRQLLCIKQKPAAGPRGVCTVPLQNVQVLYPHRGGRKEHTPDLAAPIAYTQYPI